MPRGYGAIPDRLELAERDGRTRHLAGLTGARATFALARDWSDRLDIVPDQGGTSRCVGWATSSALYLAGQASGHPIPRPSAKWAYDVARYVDSPGVLVDVGCRPRSMMDGLRRHGIVSEDRIPSTDENVNEPPPFDADLAGADAVLTGYYKAEGDAATLFRMAIDRGHFPTLAMVIHESFVDLRAASPMYDEPDGPELGRHMVTLVGYRPGSFRLLNSWGSSWGAGGFCDISDRFIGSHYVADRYVITAAPTGAK